MDYILDNISMIHFLNLIFHCGYGKECPCIWEKHAEEFRGKGPWCWYFISETVGLKKKENIHSSIICNSQNIATTCLSTDKWKDKMWYSHIMEYYSAIKRNEVLIHAATWWTLQMVTEKGRHKSANIVWLHWYKTSRIGKLREKVD